MSQPSRDMHRSSRQTRRVVALAARSSIAVMLVVLLASGSAFAQSKGASAQGKPKPAPTAAAAPAQDPKLVEAERLFVEAKRLMNEKRVSEACRAFEESQKLDPAVGTQFNIADCLEREGRIATAYRQFSDLRDVLARVGDDRAPQAEARARALEPKLPRITIRVSWSKSVSGLVVTRDGETVEHSTLGTSVPVDPGAHNIVVQATNKKDYAITVNAVEGKADVVDVPALADVERQVVVRNTGVSQRNIGLVVAGVGLAAVGTSVVLGFVAKGNYDSAVEGCSDLGDRYQCPPGNRSGDAASAQSMGTVATIVGGIGAVAIVTGGVLWFTAPKGAKIPEKQSARFDIVPVFDTKRAGLVLSGTL